jgi:hypothetical protein
MARQSRHIVKYGYNAFAFKSISAAAEAVKFFGKLEKVKSEIGPEKSDYLFFTPDPDEDRTKIELLTDMRYVPAKPPKEEKPMGLPAPKRGTILCICEKSYVAPRESCVHCGRPFSESHNRTHGTGDAQSKLRLL